MPNPSDAVGLATFAAFVIVVAATFYRPNDSVSLARFSQWTNAAFIWPAIRAARFGAFSESVVFTVTLIVSSLHHGCVSNTALREALAVETFWLMGVSLLLIVFGVAVAAVQLRRKSLSFAVISVTGLSLVIVSLVFIVGTSYASRGQLDACLIAHGVDYDTILAPRAAHVWASVDFVTAFASLVVVLVYFFQADRSVELGVFWLFVVIVLAGTLLSDHGLVSQSTVFTTVAVFAAAMIVGRIALCTCFTSPREAQSLVDRYDVRDALTGLFVGAVALAIFFSHNDAAFHGWWHMLAALALYLVVESIYR